MKLHQLRALVAIHNAGSILEASKLMHITQPALSRSIKDLEREVGFSLLQRSHKGMALTEEGKRVIDAADRGVKVRMLIDDLNTLLRDASTPQIRDGLVAAEAEVEKAAAPLPADGATPQARG